VKEAHLFIILGGNIKVQLYYIYMQATVYVDVNLSQHLNFLLLAFAQVTKSKNQFTMSPDDYTITIFREEATSVLGGFQEGSISWPNWNLGF